MNQDNKARGQNQNQQPQMGGQQKQPQANDRGNPSTTERIQPGSHGGGTQKPEGDDNKGGKQQPKY